MMASQLRRAVHQIDRMVDELLDVRAILLGEMKAMLEDVEGLKNRKPVRRAEPAILPEEALDKLRKVRVEKTKAITKKKPEELISGLEKEELEAMSDVKRSAYEIGKKAGVFR